MALPTDKQLRLFVLDYFDEEELHTFCFDYFRDVRHEFGSGMSFNEKVMELIDYCRRNGVRKNFIDALKLEKEKPYNTVFSPNQKNVAVSPPVYEPEPRNPQKIFVSHASEDGKLAQQIAKDLQNHGYDIFITPTSIRAGEKWVDAIMRGLDESGIFLVLLTPNAIKSGWVRQEANTAIALNNGNKARLLFLHVEECEPPTLWQQWQYLPFRNKDYKENFANLLRELKGEPSLPLENLVLDMERVEAFLSELDLPESEPESAPEPAAETTKESAEQARETQTESLYQQMLQAYAAENWVVVMMRAAQIEELSLDFRDVAALKAAAFQQLKKPKAEPLKEEPALASPPEAVAEVTQCLGLTKSGHQCRNKSLPGSDYCGVHAKKSAAEPQLQEVAEAPPAAIKKGEPTTSAKKSILSKQELLDMLGQYKGRQGFHLYPEISTGNQSKIRKRLDLLPKDEEILAFVVATTFGGMQAGMAFTGEGIVWRNDRFFSTLNDYSLHGRLDYANFPKSKFSKSASSQIYLGEGLGFNHAGWCQLSTEEILELLNRIKALVTGRSQS